MREQRLEYDKIHRSVVAAQRELDQMKKQLEIQKNEEFMMEDTNFRKTSNIKNGQDQYDDINKEYEMQMLNQRQYLHMIDRMQQDLIAT